MNCQLVLLPLNCGKRLSSMARTSCASSGYKQWFEITVHVWNVSSTSCVTASVAEAVKACTASVQQYKFLGNFDGTL